MQHLLHPILQSLGAALSTEIGINVLCASVFMLQCLETAMLFADADATPLLTHLKKVLALLEPTDPTDQESSKWGHQFSGCHLLTHVPGKGHRVWIFWGALYIVVQLCVYQQNSSLQPSSNSFTLL